jgi:hypothetical protein
MVFLGSCGFLAWPLGSLKFFPFSLEIVSFQFTHCFDFYGEALATHKLE